ncbi:hypothetical protein [Bosea sp. AS-1]|uniref:hypothetical protein n=1 Tax=Bosea sp. AS-1 TaxID=2015316 RepID=UPI0012FE6CAF|nr:hypothetical protein [Bosea sp. AS-1]
MLAFLMARASKPIIYAAIALGALLLAGLGFWRGFAAIERMQDKAIKVAVALNNAQWQAQIQAANDKAKAEREAQAKQAEEASRQAAEEISRLTNENADLERRNRDLPNPDACGLDADRVRLLNEKR